MLLLQSGVDITVIAMWLGHEDTATTHQYIEADLAMKEAALKRLDAPSSKPVRFKAKDRLLAFLEASDYAQFRLRVVRSGKGTADPTPHSRGLGIVQTRLCGDPHSRIRCALGFGTSAASRAIKSLLNHRPTLRQVSARQPSKLELFPAPPAEQSSACARALPLNLP